MNEFTSALSATLHEKAQEIAMSIDMQHAEGQLQKSIRTVDRRRRVWIAAVAAAAILIAGVGITFGTMLTTAQPAQPVSTTSSPATTPILFRANKLWLPLVLQLPHWVASAHHAADVDPSGLATGYSFELPNAGREIHLLSVHYMYPLGATKITRPSYTELVKDWKAVQTRGYGTVRDVTTTLVGAGPSLKLRATTMTVTFTKTAPGLDFCDAATGVPTDANGVPLVATTGTAGWTPCGAPQAGRTYHLAIIDGPIGGGGPKLSPPIVLWESSTTNDTASPTTAADFSNWLNTLIIGTPRGKGW